MKTRKPGLLISASRFAIATCLALALLGFGVAEARQGAPDLSSQSFVEPAGFSSGHLDYFKTVSGSRSRCFRLRDHRFLPTEFTGPIRPDHGVTRTWFFQESICCLRRGNESWCQTEHGVRELNEYFYGRQWEITGDLLSDNEFLYSRKSMRGLGGALVLAAVFANTAIDQNFQDWLNRQGATQPNAACGLRELGEGNYVIPVTLATYALARTWQRRHESPCPMAKAAETWSYRTNRSLLVGAPVLLSVQWLTGLRVRVNPAPDLIGDHSMTTMAPVAIRLSGPCHFWWQQKCPVGHWSRPHVMRDPDWLVMAGCATTATTCPRSCLAGRSLTRRWRRRLPPIWQRRTIAWCRWIYTDLTGWVSRFAVDLKVERSGCPSFRTRGVLVLTLRNSGQ